MEVQAQMPCTNRALQLGCNRKLCRWKSLSDILLELHSMKKQLVNKFQTQHCLFQTVFSNNFVLKFDKEIKLCSSLNIKL